MTTLTSGLGTLQVLQISGHALLEGQALHEAELVSKGLLVAVEGQGALRARRQLDLGSYPADGGGGLHDRAHRVRSIARQVVDAWPAPCQRELQGPDHVG